MKKIITVVLVAVAMMHGGAFALVCKGKFVDVDGALLNSTNDQHVLIYHVQSSGTKMPLTNKAVTRGYFEFNCVDSATMVYELVYNGRSQKIVFSSNYTGTLYSVPPSDNIVLPACAQKYPDGSYYYNNGLGEFCMDLILRRCPADADKARVTSDYLKNRIASTLPKHLCYIPSGTVVKDSSGTYIHENNCYYTE